jgi:hypothetical protein
LVQDGDEDVGEQEGGRGRRVIDIEDFMRGGGAKGGRKGIIFRIQALFLIT